MRAFRLRNQRSAFTVVELLAIVVVVFFLVLIFVPGKFIRRAHYARPICVNNLKQDGLAFRMWADDNNGKYPMAYAGNTALYPLINQGIAWTDDCATGKYEYTIFEAMSNELSTPKVVVCPQDKKRIAATNFTTDFDNTHLSYFVGLDANETNPTAFLAGDWNMVNGHRPKKGIRYLQTNQNLGWTSELHNQSGNVALADGSVVQITNSRLKTYLANTGMGTNRLLFP